MDQKWKTVLLHLLSMLHFLKCSAYQNSEINYMVSSDLIRVTCRYTGNATVSAVSWFNGSTAVPLTIEPELCKPLSVSKSSFDASRNLNYNCNLSSNNIYTLSFKLVPHTDYNKTMGCTFLDPNPGEPKANVTILEKGISRDGVGGVGGDLSPLAIAFIGVAIFAVFVAAVAFACYKFKRKTGCGMIKLAELEHGYYVANGDADQETKETSKYKDIHEDEK